jgi:hypothetical protein
VGELMLMLRLMLRLRLRLRLRLGLSTSDEEGGPHQVESSLARDSTAGVV